MWFEILPSAGIIVAALAAPTAVAYYTNKLLIGNPFRRDLRFEATRFWYQRDRRLTDNPYRLQVANDHKWDDGDFKCCELFQGLESLPDK